MRYLILIALPNAWVEGSILTLACAAGAEAITVNTTTVTSTGPLSTTFMRRGSALAIVAQTETAQTFTATGPDGTVNLTASMLAEPALPVYGIADIFKPEARVPAIAGGVLGLLLGRSR